MTYMNSARTCDTCIHKDVCSYSEDLKTYQQVIDSIRVTYKGHELPLKNISWVSTLVLECVNWAYAQQVRMIEI